MTIETLAPVPVAFTITEAMLFQAMQAQISSNPAIVDIDFALVDFVPGNINLTVRMTDGTLGEVAVSVVDADGFVVFQIDSITVGGAAAPVAFVESVQRELMTLLVDSFDVLLVQQFGAWQYVASMVVTEMEIVVEAMP